MNRILLAAAAVCIILALATNAIPVRMMRERIASSQHQHQHDSSHVQLTTSSSASGYVDPPLSSQWELIHPPTGLGGKITFLAPSSSASSGSKTPTSTPTPTTPHTFTVSYTPNTPSSTNTKWQLTTTFTNGRALLKLAPSGCDLLIVQDTTQQTQFDIVRQGSTTSATIDSKTCGGINPKAVMGLWKRTNMSPTTTSTPPPPPPQTTSPPITSGGPTIKKGFPQHPTLLTTTTTEVNTNLVGTDSSTNGFVDPPPSSVWTQSPPAVGIDGKITFSIPKPGTPGLPTTGVIPPHTYLLTFIPTNPKNPVPTNKQWQQIATFTNGRAALKFSPTCEFMIVQDAQEAAAHFTIVHKLILPPDIKACGGLDPKAIVGFWRRTG